MLLGFPSTGLHTNGYSLARKLFFEVAKYKPEQYVNALKEKAGAALMKTHRSYLSLIKKLTANDYAAGLAHITGGGITENLPRILPKDRFRPRRTRLAGRFCPSSSTCSSSATSTQDEMLRTFNMGIGLIAVVPAERFKRCKSMLDRAGEKNYVIGRIIKGDRKVVYA